MNFEIRADGHDIEEAGQATYGMSNLRPEATGLSFIVFVPQRDDARHAARVNWSPQPKVKRERLGSYAVSPFDHKADPRLDKQNEDALKRWVDLSRDVLQRY